MTSLDIVDELTYRCYRWNRLYYGLRPESCFQLWGQVPVEQMESRFQSERRPHAA